MFIRSIFIGFVLGMIYAGAYTQTLIDLLLGAPPAQMLGGLAQSVEGQVRGSVSSNGTLKAMVGASIIFGFTVLSFVVWPMIERAAMSIGGLMSRIRENQAEWQGQEKVK